MPESNDLTVLPASADEAPPRSEYDLDLHPGGADEEIIEDEMVRIPGKPRVVVGYMPDRDAVNRNEPMVAIGSPEDVAVVLEGAGYLIGHPNPEPDTEGERTPWGPSGLLRYSTEIEVSATEIEPWRFEIELGAGMARRLHEGTPWREGMVKALASGLNGVMNAEEAAAARERGPIVDSEGAEAVGEYRIRVSVPNTDVQAVVDRLAAEHGCRREEVAAHVTGTGMALRKAAGEDLMEMAGRLRAGRM